MHLFIHFNDGTENNCDQQSYYEESDEEDEADLYGNDDVSSKEKVLLTIWKFLIAFYQLRRVSMKSIYITFISIYYYATKNHCNQNNNAR